MAVFERLQANSWLCYLEIILEDPPGLSQRSWPHNLLWKKELSEHSDMKKPGEGSSKGQWESRLKRGLIIWTHVVLESLLCTRGWGERDNKNKQGEGFPCLGEGCSQDMLNMCTLFQQLLSPAPFHHLLPCPCHSALLFSQDSPLSEKSCLFIWFLVDYLSLPVEGELQGSLLHITPNPWTGTWQLLLA